MIQFKTKPFSRRDLNDSYSLILKYENQMWFGQWTSRGLTRPSFSNAKGTVCTIEYETIETEQIETRM
jgi:hypothetical protein